MLDRRPVFVQDEPALEIALPQVGVQPELTLLQRGRLANVEALVAQIFRRYQETPHGPLGRDYQEIVKDNKSASYGDQKPNWLCATHQHPCQIPGLEGGFATAQKLRSRRRDIVHHAIL